MDRLHLLKLHCTVTCRSSLLLLADGHNGWYKGFFLDQLNKMKGWQHYIETVSAETKGSREAALSLVLLYFSIFVCYWRQNVDVPGQTKILWRGQTAIRNNLNKTQRKRTVDVVTNNNKRTGSSLGKLCTFNLCIKTLPSFKVDGISTRLTDLT